jgi:predicted permease
MPAVAVDVRTALRRIGREPGFAAFAVLIVALGVAAATAVFSVLSPLLLRPLPFREPERLVWVANTGEGGLSSVTSRTANLRDYRALARSFDGLTGYNAFFEYGSFTLVGRGAPERLVGVGVAPDFLPVLGVRPLLGRNFTAEEGAQGGPRAAILTHAFWQRRFGGDPAVVGRAVTLNNEPVAVVGVLPPSFDFASTFAPASRVDFLGAFPVSDETDRIGNTLAIIGRLRPGATVQGAQTELDQINARLKQADPGRWGLGAVVTGLRDHVAGGFRAPLLVLAAGATLVLLVACANLSNLLLTRAHRRAQEMTVRSALGAGRGRLLTHALTESLLLAAGGGVLGAALAFWITRWVAGTSAVSVPLLRTASVDARALGFAVAVTLLTGLAVGIAPALQVSRGREASALRAAGRGASDGRRSAAVREVLVVAEVALACVLLVGGGLLLRSFTRVLDVDLGFRPAGAVAWQLSTLRDFPNDTARAAFFEGVAERVRAVPGVEAVGLTDTPPLGRNREWWVRAKGAAYEKDGGENAFPRLVDSRYLGAMGVPLVAGRPLTPQDGAASPKVTILNRTAAARLFPGADPLGRVVLLGDEEWQVVGVAGDVRHQALEKTSGLEMYFPYAQKPDFRTLTMVVRSRLPAPALAGPVAAALRAVDPTMPTGDYRPLDAVVEQATSPRRFVLAILGAFAGTALVLAALGLYAVLSYAVGQRVREIGIRMALGASAARVRRGVVRRTLLLAGAGVAVGAAVSLGTSRLLASQLFGVGAADPAAFAGAAALLLAVAALAGYVPARRAAGTEPLVALRGP